MADELLVRDVMRIGVATCKENDALPVVAVQMLERGETAVAVMDDEGNTAGWINEQHLANAYLRLCAAGGEQALTAADAMDEAVPEFPAVDVPLASAVQYMVDKGVSHLFFLHHAGGRAWPASLLSWRDVVRVMAGPEYTRDQGSGAPRPTPMDLFRQRYNRTGR